MSDAAVTITINGLEPRLQLIEDQLRELRNATLTKDESAILKIGLTHVLNELKKIRSVGGKTL